MSVNENENSMISDMKMAKQGYEAAKLSGIGLARAKERMMNTAFNYYDALLDAVIERERLAEENNMLLDALDKADREAKGSKAAGKRSTGKVLDEVTEASHGISQAGDP